MYPVNYDVPWTKCLWYRYGTTLIWHTVKDSTESFSLESWDSFQMMTIFKMKEEN